MPMLWTTVFLGSQNEFLVKIYRLETSKRGYNLKYYTSSEKFKKAVNLLGKSLGRERAYNTPKPHQGGSNMENYLYSLYQMVLKSLTFYLGVDQEKKKAGRPPKVSDLQLCASYILSYIIFRKTRTQKVYKLLKELR